jgi:hypothetical protein
MSMKLTRKDRKHLEFILGRVQAARKDLDRFAIAVPNYGPGPNIHTLGTLDKDRRAAIGNSKDPEHLQIVMKDHTLLLCGLEDAEQGLMHALYDPPERKHQEAPQ